MPASAVASAAICECVLFNNWTENNMISAMSALVMPNPPTTTMRMLPSSVLCVFVRIRRATK